MALSRDDEVMALHAEYALEYMKQARKCEKRKVNVHKDIIKMYSDNIAYTKKVLAQYDLNGKVKMVHIRFLEVKIYMNKKYVFICNERGLEETCSEIAKHAKKAGYDFFAFAGKVYYTLGNFHFKTAFTVNDLY